MRLTCIGTGTAAPEPDRVCSGYLVETSGLRLLFDCGGGVVHSMARLGVDWRGLTHLVLTHFHNDHIGDVPLLFFAWKYGMRPGRSAPLDMIGPRGTGRLLERMAGVFGVHLDDPGFEVRLAEIEPGTEHRLNDVARIRACKTPHTDESLAYRLETGERTFCYTGDTGRSAELGVFARDADALVVECSMPEDEAMSTHLTPSGVAELARAALPGRLLVTHVYPQLPRDRVPGLVQAAGWSAAVQLVHDGLHIEL